MAAIDVGSLANIGWWRVHDKSGAGGDDLDVLVEELVADLEAGSVVALGFEAPLFIPRPSVSSGLNKQRLGERGRPWCAGAGTGALALGLQQSTFVLSAIAARVEIPPTVGVDCEALFAGTAQLVIWEAFVSGRAKNRRSVTPHIDDARSAVAEFQARVDSGSVHTDVDDVDVLSLAGAALLVSGLTDDITLLTRPCSVVRAPDLDADDA